MTRLKTAVMALVMVTVLTSLVPAIPARAEWYNNSSSTSTSKRKSKSSKLDWEDLERFNSFDQWFDYYDDYWDGYSNKYNRDWSAVEGWSSYDAWFDAYWDNYWYNKWDGKRSGSSKKKNYYGSDLSSLPRSTTLEKAAYQELQGLDRRAKNWKILRKYVRASSNGNEIVTRITFKSSSWIFRVAYVQRGNEGFYRQTKSDGRVVRVRKAGVYDLLAHPRKYYRR